MLKQRSSVHVLTLSMLPSLQGVYARVSALYHNWLVPHTCFMSDVAPEYMDCANVDVSHLEARYRDDDDGYTSPDDDDDDALPDEDAADAFKEALEEEAEDEEPLQLLDHCQGGCDFDIDCEGDMVCFQKDQNDKGLPGCDPVKRKAGNFCVRPQDLTLTQTLQLRAVAKKKKTPPRYYDV
jgi:hypothetical protein